MRLAIERLLTPGSIPKLAMRRCVLGKGTLGLFPPWRRSGLPVVVAQPDERLAKAELKRNACVCVIRQEQNAWLTRAN